MYALIHNSQLILGPIKYNYRMINSDLEDLEVNAKVSPRDYENVPIQLDENTHLLSAVEIIPSYDGRFSGLGNFEWEIIQENEVPVRVEMTYSINDKSLEQIKEEYKSQVTPIRREKENTVIDVVIGNNTISVSTSRESRLSFISKSLSSSGSYNFKFDNGIWLEVTTTELETIISQIDAKVQEAFDWEYLKLQEIDACISGEEVYAVILREPQEPVEGPNALPTNN